MKRLQALTNYDYVYKKLIKQANNSVDNDKKYICSIAARIIKFKMERLATNVFDYAIISEIGQVIYDYQTKKYGDREFINPQELHYDVLNKLIPKCIYNGIAYRALLFDKNVLKSKNTIKNDLKQIICTGRIESWSLSKKFVNNAENELFVGYYDKTTHFVARLQATINNGVDIEEFWRGAKQYLEEDLEYHFLDIQDSFKNEKEILAITPSNYTIYNIPQIQKEVFI